MEGIRRLKRPLKDEEDLILKTYVQDRQRSVAHLSQAIEAVLDLQFDRKRIVTFSIHNFILPILSRLSFEIN